MSLAFPLYFYYSIFSHKMQEPPGVTSKERPHSDYILPEYTGKIQSIKSPALYHFRYVLARGVFFVPKNHID